MIECAEVLETDRLFLEPFTQLHLTDRYVAWLNDPKVVKYSEQRHLAHTRESCQQYLNSFIESPHFFYAIMLKDDSSPIKHIGNITAFINKHNKIADVGILIGETSMWGKGYGLEAWKVFCNYLIVSGVRKITAGTMAINHGMLRIMKKSGMIFEGKRLRHFLHEGNEVDLMMYALIP